MVEINVHLVRYYQNPHTQAGIRVPPPETSKNMDVFEEPTGTYLWRVSGGGTRVAATGWH